MWDLVPAIDLHSGLVMSVSSFLIMLLVQIQPLVDNVALVSRGIRSASRAALRLLARDDSVVVPGADDEEDDSGGGVAPARQARRHCERCARRRGASRSDVAAVVERLGLLPCGGHDDGEACGGCEAAWAVDDLLESKVASEAELREAFYVFDRDEDGFVGAGELWNVMRRLGMAEGARPEDCRSMIAAHDADGDGRISFREFRAMMENAV
ncbi:putative calcium-binding protein CML43 [Panicum miliaceum]|uniref:Calcium-binding protein CML43 n=1 Tax=Panicum miliaceum TaxID=4540 RepID=A0A3L6TEA2_PANMI|nr:putative calcium-binding protein CML43 [Panicum miliaceum]